MWNNRFLALVPTAGGTTIQTIKNDRPERSYEMTDSMPRGGSGPNRQVFEEGP